MKPFPLFIRPISHIFHVNMRFNSVALLTGATAVAAGNTATLLLPGFQGHELQAGVLNSVCARSRRLRHYILNYERDAFN